MLVLLAEGLCTKAIAARLVITENTVRNHIQSILASLDAHNRLQAVAIARRRGLLP